MYAVLGLKGTQCDSENKLSFTPIFNFSLDSHRYSPHSKLYHKYGYNKSIHQIDNLNQLLKSLSNEISIPFNDKAIKSILIILIHYTGVCKQSHWNKIYHKRGFSRNYQL